MKGLLKLFGLDMAKLINTRNTRGITVDDNDIILDPTLMLPPPKMRGRITGVRVQDDEIIQTFGKENGDLATESRHSNYIAYRGGVRSIVFGHYKDHLMAGYSKTTVSGGLLVYMPDYNKIPKSLSPH